MMLEKSGLLLTAGTLAIGGVGVWLAYDERTQRLRTPFAEPPFSVALVASVSALLPAELAGVNDRGPATRSCADSFGTGEDCPALGPADEAVCTNFLAKRCREFKSVFKPKVAAAAIACLRNLQGNAACDPARVDRCAEEALAACQEPSSDPSGPAIPGQ